MKTNVVTLDGRGRIAVPAELRAHMGLEPGDVLFVQIEGDGAVLRLAKAEESFGALGVREYWAGRTKNLRTFAEEEGFVLDGESAAQD